MRQPFESVPEWPFYCVAARTPRPRAAPIPPTAQKALEIDESLAEAHTTLAEAHADYDWDWLACEKEFKRAIEPNPNYDSAHKSHAAYLALMRSQPEAMTEVQRAQQPDPLSPIISANAASR